MYIKMESNPKTSKSFLKIYLLYSNNFLFDKKFKNRIKKKKINQAKFFLVRKNFRKKILCWTKNFDFNMCWPAPI